MYWWIGEDGRRKITNRTMERGDIEQFLVTYNKNYAENYSYLDQREFQEKPDALARNSHGEWMAIEHTKMIDDSNVVAANAKIPKREVLDPYKVKRTDFTRDDVLRRVMEKRLKSFENIPEIFSPIQHIILINIDDSFDPEGLVEMLREKPIDLNEFPEIAQIFFLLYMAGAPGQWVIHPIGMSHA
jgi:hypothetical protein